jgi:multicomponent Na+:H+ antiporter subunit G
VTARDVLVDVLLGLGVAIELVCCVGMVAMHNAFDRLHFLGPASTVGPVCIAAAIVVSDSLSQSGVKAVIIAALLIAMGPVLTHATGRALRVRQFDHWGALPTERVDRR